MNWTHKERIQRRVKLTKLIGLNENGSYEWKETDMYTTLFVYFKNSTFQIYFHVVESSNMYITLKFIQKHSHLFSSETLCIDAYSSVEDIAKKIREWQLWACLHHEQI